MIFIATVASQFRPFDHGYEINSNVSHNTVESKPLFEPQNLSQWEYPQPNQTSRNCLSRTFISAFDMYGMPHFHTNQST